MIKEFQPLDGREITVNTLSANTISDTTAVVLLAANPNRFRVEVGHDGIKTVFVRKYPASDDNIKRGFRLGEDGKGSVTPYMIQVNEKGEIYKGEISSIAESSGSQVFVEEWSYA